jgi:hypothetical protein
MVYGKRLAKYFRKIDESCNKAHIFFIAKE